MTWKQVTERDCTEWKLSAIDPHDRDTWRSCVRSAIHAAGQLPGRGLLLWILFILSKNITLLFSPHEPVAFVCLLSKVV